MASNKDNINLLTNPERRSYPKPSEPPLRWRNQTIQIAAISDDQKDTLDNIGSQLDGVTKQLDSILNITDSILRPIISIIRSVEDPFAAVIEQIVSQVEKILTAIENQGIFILDFATPFIRENTTAKVFETLSPANISYVRKWNQYILMQKARKTFGGYDQERLNEAGITTNDNGELVDSSPRNFSIQRILGNNPEGRQGNALNLTNTEIQQLSDISFKIQIAYEWVDRYNTDAAKMMDEIVRRYESLDKAVRATVVRSVAWNHYIGAKEIPEVSSTTPELPVAFIIINRKLSDMPETIQQANFLSEAFKSSRPNSIIRWSGSAIDGQVNYSSSLVQIEPDLDDIGKLKDEYDKTIIRITEFAEAVDEIEKAYSDNIADFATKKQEIYRLIEKDLREQNGMRVVHRLDTTQAEAYNARYDSVLITQIQKVINDTSNQFTQAQKEAVLPLVNNKVSDFTTADMIDTFMGYRYDLNIAELARNQVIENANRETLSFNKVIKFINQEVENQGRISNLASLPTKPRKKSVNIDPPLQSIADREVFLYDQETDINLDSQQSQAALQLLQIVSEQVEEVDLQETNFNVIKNDYKKLALAALTKLRNAFDRLDDATDALPGAAQTVANSPTTPASTLLNNEFSDNINRIIEAIIDIKKIFTVYKIRLKTIEDLASQTTRDESKKIIEFEKFFVQLMTGDYDFSPEKIVMGYLQEYVDFITAEENIFQYYQTGFETPVAQPELERRIEILQYFRGLDSRFISEGVQKPAQFYTNINNTNINIDRMFVQIVERIDRVSKDALRNFDALRDKIVADLEELQNVASCSTNRSGVILPDEVKTRIKKQYAEEQAQLDALIQRRDQLTSILNNKLAQIPGTVSNNSATDGMPDASNITTRSQKIEFVNELNDIVEEVGGFTYRVDARNDIVATENLESGSLLKRIASQNYKLNTLKESSIQRDREARDEYNTTNIQTSTYRQIAALQQQLIEADNRIEIAIYRGASDGEIAAFKQQKSEIQKQVNELQNFQKAIDGKFITGDASIYEEIFKTMELAGRAISETTSIISQIDSARQADQISEETYNTLLGIGVENSENNGVRKIFEDGTVAFNITDNSDATGIFGNTGLTRNEVINLFDLVSSTGSDLRTGAGESLQIQLTFDYSELVSYSDNIGDPAELDGVGPAIPRMSLHFIDRLNDFQAIRSKMSQKLAQANNRKPSERNDAGEVDAENQWIETVSKDEWITRLMQRFRDTRDLGRPVFIDDVSTASGVEALFGAKAQQTLDNIANAGTMTVVIAASVSTDVQKVVDDIKNLYYFITDPSKYNERLEYFKKKFTENLSGLSFTQFVENGKRFLDYSELTDVIDRVKESNSVYRSGDKECADRLYSPTKQERVDYWFSIKLGDLFIVADLFDSIRRVLAKIQFSITPKKGLADILEGLLNFIRSRIEILKKIVASIGLIIELIDFIANLHFSVTTLTISGVRSANDLERKIRAALDFPNPFRVTSPYDPMYILSYVFVMPDSFYSSTFKTIFKDAPPQANNLNNGQIQTAFGQEAEDTTKDLFNGIGDIGASDNPLLI